METFLGSSVRKGSLDRDLVLNSISSGIPSVSVLEVAAEENNFGNNDDGIVSREDPVVAIHGVEVNGCVVRLSMDTHSRIDETDAMDDEGNGRNVMIVSWPMNTVILCTVRS